MSNTTLTQGPITKVMLTKKFSIDAMFDGLRPDQHIDRKDASIHNSRFRQCELQEDVQAAFSFMPIEGVMGIEDIIEFAKANMLDHERNCTLRALYRIMKDGDPILEEAVGKYIIIPEASSQGKSSVIVYEPAYENRLVWSMATRQLHHGICGHKAFKAVIPKVSLPPVQYW
jgi:hypothetical protein